MKWITDKPLPDAIRQLIQDKMQEWFLDPSKGVPSLEEVYGSRLGWFPTHASNPTKLQAYVYHEGEWYGLGFSRFVPL